MKHRDIAIRDMNAAGYWFERHGGKHDLYKNPDLGTSITLKRGHFDETDLRYIRKEIKSKSKGGR